jgi:hypothetical protein
MDKQHAVAGCAESVAANEHQQHEARPPARGVRRGQKIGVSVGLDPAAYKRLDAIGRLRAMGGSAAPALGALVREAVEAGLPELERRARRFSSTSAITG